VDERSDRVDDLAILGVTEFYREKGNHIVTR
jgi:hypothetical protein